MKNLISSFIMIRDYITAAPRNYCRQSLKICRPINSMFIFHIIYSIMSNKKKINNDSYIAHNSQFRTVNDIEWHKRRFEEYNKINIFSKMGFHSIIIEKNPDIRGAHIDIGCGGGWLLNKTAPLFKKVIGIEPSKSAIDIAREITKEHENIEFINLPMIEALEFIDFRVPCLFTTSAVMSHIGDYYVKKFLEILSHKAPKNSVLYFYEPYDKNIQVSLWYIRRKEWWIKNLPNWELSFHDIKDGGYYKGISGKHIGHSVVRKRRMSFNSIIFDIWWRISGIYYKVRFGSPRIIRKLKAYICG